MKKLMPKVVFVALLPLALAACDWVKNPTVQYDLSGSLLGNAPTGKGSIKLALVGGALSTDPVQNIKVPQINFANSAFTVDLPDSPNAVLGFYELIAYADSNGNGQYDAGEPRSKTNSGNLLTYTGNTHKWTRGSTVIRENDKSVNRISNYDISW